MERPSVGSSCQRYFGQSAKLEKKEKSNAWLGAETRGKRLLGGGAHAQVPSPLIRCPGSRAARGQEAAAA